MPTPRVKMEDSAVALNEGESVLEALLRSGWDIPHSCRSGCCQSCLLQVKSGQVPAGSQTGLRASQIQQDQFLSCLARLKTDQELVVQWPDNPQTAVDAVLDSIQFSSPSIAQVYLKTSGPFDFHAGQFIHVVRDDGLLRSYSLANLPGSDVLELHVKQVPGGQMSHWLTDSANLGTSLQVRGPIGDCFYQSDSPEQPILLTGTGTGLAPLLGVMRDAIQRQHTGPIHLFHGALNRQGLYLIPALQQLQREYANIHYHPGTLVAEATPELDIDFHGPLDQHVLQHLPDLKGWRVYLCGAPEFVLPMRRKVFLAGADSRQIHADAFQMAPASLT